MYMNYEFLVSITLFVTIVMFYMFFQQFSLQIYCFFSNKYYLQLTNYRLQLSIFISADEK